MNADGICSACVGHDEKIASIDWGERQRDLHIIIDELRKKRRGAYDCIVPVSGGKDSTYQTHKVKELGLRPLCVTYKTPLRTPLGQENLDNLVKTLGMDLLELTVSPETERKFIEKAIREVGDCGLPQHMGIFSFTLRTAVQMDIPLIIWGENSTLEYGGTEAQRNNPFLDRKWAMEHGCLKDRIAEDWVDENLTREEMEPFRFPDDDHFARAKVSSLFLGHFYKWDPVENARVSQSLGFKPNPDGPVMGIYDFADVDCQLITFHHYPKWYKFGMTRTFDNVSVEIRNGRMSREEGVEWIRKNGDDRPPELHLAGIANFLGKEVQDLFAMIEPFRNKDIWKKDDNNRWYIPDYIVPDAQF